MKLKLMSILLKFALAFYEYYSLKQARDSDKEELAKLRAMLVKATKFNGNVADVIKDFDNKSDAEIRGYFDE